MKCTCCTQILHVWPVAVTRHECSFPHFGLKHSARSIWKSSGKWGKKPLRSLNYSVMCGASQTLNCLFLPSTQTIHRKYRRSKQNHSQFKRELFPQCTASYMAIFQRWLQTCKEACTLEAWSCHTNFSKLDWSSWKRRTARESILLKTEGYVLSSFHIGILVIWTWFTTNFQQTLICIQNPKYEKICSSKLKCSLPHKAAPILSNEQWDSIGNSGFGR